MKILVVGSGGREHALAWKLAQSPEAERFFCAPGNAGTEGVAENVPIVANDLPRLVRFAKENRIDFTVIGPDDPLAAGVVDLFVAEKLSVFGPTKAAAQLEASKIFAKNLMLATQIPTAKARTFSATDEALRYLDDATFPIVIKADGLALGKGVVIAATKGEAIKATRAMMEDGVFGAAGRRVVMEECLCGSECSVHALVSGQDFRMLATARDHKRALDGDRGANTGGMGAVSPAEDWTPKREHEFLEKVMQPLCRELVNGLEFRGLLFPGLILTNDGLRVLEFNCRFGDPETQAILPRLKSDLLPLLVKTSTGGLAEATIEFDPRPAVTVIMASGGYPGKYETGKPIAGLEEAGQQPDVVIFHAGTKRGQDGRILTAGGRVLAITALGANVALARERAYEAVAKIDFEGAFFRRDIAHALSQS